jgi:hypothetical protein
VLTIDGQCFDAWGGLAGRFQGSVVIDEWGFGWGETSWRAIVGGFRAQMSSGHRPVRLPTPSCPRGGDTAP